MLAASVRRMRGKCDAHGIDGNRPQRRQWARSLPGDLKENPRIPEKEEELKGKELVP